MRGLGFPVTSAVVCAYGIPSVLGWLVLLTGIQPLAWMPDWAWSRLILVIPAAAVGFMWLGWKMREWSNP